MILFKHLPLDFFWQFFFCVFLLSRKDMETSITPKCLQLADQIWIHLQKIWWSDLHQLQNEDGCKMPQKYKSIEKVETYIFILYCYSTILQL